MQAVCSQFYQRFRQVPDVGLGGRMERVHEVAGILECQTIAFGLDISSENDVRMRNIDISLV